MLSYQPEEADRDGMDVVSDKTEKNEQEERTKKYWGEEAERGKKQKAEGQQSKLESPERSP